MFILNAAFWISGLIGLFCLIIGVGAVIRPEPMSKKFGIPVKGDALPYVVSTGIRDVAIGLMILILTYLQNWQSLGFSFLFLAIVAISDFAVVIKFGNKKASLIHLFGAISVTAIGIVLLNIS